VLGQLKIRFRDAKIRKDAKVKIRTE